jgi:hypothetical protein
MAKLTIIFGLLAVGTTCSLLAWRYIQRTIGPTDTAS